MFVRLVSLLIILYISLVASRYENFVSGFLTTDRITTASDGSINIAAPSGSITFNGDFSINNRSVLQYIQTAQSTLIDADHLNLLHLSTLRYQGTKVTFPSK
jgi:hypothetical protein